jgi:CubicO group peptidase (beta-lactamase class C family)
MNQWFACAVLLLLLAARTHAQTTVDLAEPLAEAANHNSNPGAAALCAARASDVLGFAVVKGGKLVASGGTSSMENVWSVTKTWVATLVGIMVQKGLVSLSTTLEAALPSVDWARVNNASDKKKITIAQMLSMSSGLEAKCMSYGDQSTVEAVLSSPSFSSTIIGKFYYLCSGSILSYVIYHNTGKTPMAYAQTELFPALGITRSIAWEPAHGSDGIQESGHGLVLGPSELVKLGQLYRQGGATGGMASTQLIPAEFVAASQVNQLQPADEKISFVDLLYLGRACKFKSNGAGYGYMKWLFETPKGSADCAVGHAGQFICTWPDLDVVVAITSSVTSDYTSSCELLDLFSDVDLDFDSRSPPVDSRSTAGGQNDTSVQKSTSDSDTSVQKSTSDSAGARLYPSRILITLTAVLVCRSL